MALIADHDHIRVDLVRVVTDLQVRFTVTAVTDGLDVERFGAFGDLLDLLAPPLFLLERL